MVRARTSDPAGWRTRCRVATIVLSLGLLVGACSGDDASEATEDGSRDQNAVDDETTTTDKTGATSSEDDESTSTSAEGSPDGTEVETTTSSSVDGTSGPGGEPQGDPEPTPARVTAVEDIVAKPDSYVGQRVTARGRVFFLEQCPPEPSKSTPCTLTAYLAGEGRSSLGFAEQDDALVLARGNARISCVQDGGRTACDGWVNGERYDVTGDVRRQRLGGREVDDIELDVTEKQQV